MQDRLEDLLFFEDLPEDQQQELRTTWQEDPTMTKAFVEWQHLRSLLRDRLNTHLPDRQLLVLYALDASGRTHLLTEKEHLALSEARPAIEEALQAYPALSSVITQIEEQSADFDALWQVYVEAPQISRAPDDESILPPQRLRKVLLRAWPVAAVITVLMLVTIWIKLTPTPVEQTIVKAAPGNVQVVELADGSTIRLLGGSVLTYDTPTAETPFSRHVQLEGRAFFDVIPDEKRFSVETPTAVTTVLGTSFGIQADQQQMEVVLATGRIAVTSRETSERVVILKPGERSLVARNALPSTPETVELSEALAWTGLFIYRAVTLESVVKQLRAYFATPIEIEPTLTLEEITGTFNQNQSLEEILGTLATTLQVNLRGDDTEGYLLTTATDSLE